MKKTVTHKDSTGMPLRNLSWSEKKANKFQWFKDWAAFLKGSSGFDVRNQGTTQRKEHLQTLYNVYNNQFPAKWFTHVTNPLNTTKKAYSGFPARIRPVNYLRTNIDLLLGEFLQRPIKFQIKTEKGYSRFKTQLNNQLNATIQAFYEELSEAEDPEAVENPDLAALAVQFKANYQDKLSIRSQRKLQAIMREYKIKRELLKCKKDYLIAGEAYTFKTLMNNGKFLFQRVSPIDFDYERSTIHTMACKSSWAMCRYHMSPAEITDMFYDELTDKDYKTIDDSLTNYTDSRQNFLSYIDGAQGAHNKNTVFHYQWKGRKQVLEVSGIDEEGEPYEFEADENYEATEEETVVKTWRNEVYEIWEIAPDLYVGARALPYQEDLSYNGRTYSDTETRPMSVLEMGLPIQILLMVNHFKLESTIVKSKDKIVLMDRHVIPRTEGWNEEKFFYHAEAKGWGLIDRNQNKVDKSYNQYQVLDLTLYERIEQLIRVAEYLKQSWDDLLGISRPRKGQTAPSDAVGVTNTAMIQSNIITDMIFYTFEELIEDELSGLLELSRIADSWGVPADSWMLDDFDEAIAEIDSLEASLAKQKVWLEYNTDELRKLARAKEYVESMIQNGTPLSQVFELIDSENMAELKVKIAAMEEEAMERAEQSAQSESDREARLIEIQNDFEEFKALLDTDKMHEEYDRKEDLEYIKGSFNTYTFQDGDANDNGIPDATEVMKINQKARADDNKTAINRQKLKDDREARKQERELRMKELAQKQESDKRKAKVDMAKVKAQKAAAKKKSATKK
jgi:hypothetical protein